MARGTQIDMVIPKGLIDAIKFWETKEANRVVREALDASKRAPIAAMKQLVKVVRATSEQSTGATLRAIKHKVRYPRKMVPKTGYMLASIDANHFERHREAKGGEYKKRFRRGKQRRLIGIQTRRVGGARRNKHVISFQKRSVRRGRGGRDRFQLNKPARYWHLINNGFKHRSGTVFPGHHFLDKAFASARTEQLNSFVNKLSSGVKRGMKP